jgi:hypothetical protein
LESPFVTFRQYGILDSRWKIDSLSVYLKITANGLALGVRAGFQGTKLSTQHKSLIEKLNLNFTTSPRMTPNACYA